MAESYEIETQREITDVDPSTGDLLDYWEIIAKAKPSGVAFKVRLPVQGATASGADALLAAKAAEFNNLERM